LVNVDRNLAANEVNGFLALATVAFRLQTLARGGNPARAELIDIHQMKRRNPCELTKPQRSLGMQRILGEQNTFR
jgi:hypothetical protein